MSSESLFKFSSDFLFSELFSNSEHFTAETFKAAINKHSELWFIYFNTYYLKIKEFKVYYETLIVEAQ